MMAAVFPLTSSAIQRRRVMVHEVRAGFAEQIIIESGRDPSSIEHVFHLVEQAADLGLIFNTGNLVEFLQELFLSLVQLRRSLYPHFDVKIAFAVAVQDGHTLVAYADFGAGLRAVWELSALSPSIVGTMISAPRAA